MQTINFQEVKNNVSFRDILNKYNIDSPSRDSFRIPCPLHRGEHDNCHIDTRKSLYYCFQCKAGGDVIDFVAAMENCNVGQAAKLLGKDRDIYRETSDFEMMTVKTNMALEVWRERQGTPPSIESLPKTEALDNWRGLSKEAIQAFGLRRIPGEGWGSGVFIPLKDWSGMLVGYAIRHPEEFLSSTKAPKYLNSDGLKKKGLLFGLFENKQAIIDAGHAILVEGQYDAMRVWDSGKKNVVAVMGSTLSAEQSLILMRYTSNLVLCLDGDEAGRKGVMDIRNRFGSIFNITTIQLEEGEDPGSNPGIAL